MTVEYSELIKKLSDLKVANDEIESNPLYKVLGEDPNIYISLGPPSMPLSLKVQNVGTVMGIFDGFSLSTEIDLPPNLSQEWFDLKTKIMEYLTTNSSEKVSEIEQLQK